jgi:hypothetical protein
MIGIKPQDRLKRLASKLDAIAEADQRRIDEARRVAELRLRGARELHALCKYVVAQLNPLLTRLQIELSPPEFTDEGFRDPGKNILQVQARGRIVQIAYEATDATTSTEQFRIPYIIQGAVRWFNQDRLDREEMDEQWVFYCVERDGCRWRFLDPRSRRTGQLDSDYLFGMLEQLV